MSGDWTGKEILESTRFGKLWIVLRLRKDGVIGLRRLRKKKDRFYMADKLEWKKIKEPEAKVDLEIGNLVFMSQDKALSRLVMPESLVEQVLGRKYLKKVKGEFLEQRD